jgi:hypothetical protein
MLYLFYSLTPTLSQRERGQSAEWPIDPAFSRNPKPPAFSRWRIHFYFALIVFFAFLFRASCPSPLLHPSMGFALRASLRLFKFDPVEFVRPHFVRSRIFQKFLSRTNVFIDLYTKALDSRLRTLLSGISPSCLRRQASSVLSHWITEYIHVFCPYGPAIGCSNLLLADLVRLKTCRNDGA